MRPLRHALSLVLALAMVLAAPGPVSPVIAEAASDAGGMHVTQPAERAPGADHCPIPSDDQSSSCTTHCIMGGVHEQLPFLATAPREQSCAIQQLAKGAHQLKQICGLVVQADWRPPCPPLDFAAKVFDSLIEFTSRYRL